MPDKRLCGARIHLAAPGGGAACGAHSPGRTHPDRFREVLTSEHLALVDCKHCKRTTQWRENDQYKLRLFVMIDGKKTLNPLLALPIEKKVSNG